MTTADKIKDAIKKFRITVVGENIKVNATNSQMKAACFKRELAFIKAHKQEIIDFINAENERIDRELDEKYNSEQFRALEQIAKLERAMYSENSDL